MYKKTCIDCKTTHGAYEGELDDLGYINLKYSCPKCKKYTTRRVPFQVGPQVKPLEGFSFLNNRARGGRRPVIDR